MPRLRHVVAWTPPPPEPAVQRLEHVAASTAGPEDEPEPVEPPAGMLTAVVSRWTWLISALIQRHRGQECLGWELIAGGPR